ncbi:Rcs stress response system protein RcsF [Gallaecimonas sp. GXIMD4217]|uniref:Rcs stress response system protein RcsF n=1 Tax=Gallaecimonas sp. GXIMD4217 TaxID=3131927 RepID=UPI00311B1CF2
MKYWLLSAAALALAGCAGSYQVDSNLDGAAIQDYFVPSRVAVYSPDALAGKPYRSLGLVQGQHCQQAANAPPASLAEARTDARRQAYQLGGNGIVFRQCLLLSEDAAPGCLSQALCQGEAIWRESP